MRSLVGELVPRIRNAAADLPVAYEGRPSLPIFSRSDAQGQMQSFSADPSLFATVTMLATAVAQSRWGLYRTAASGDDADRVKVTEHAVLDLWRRPNLWMTGPEFRERTGQYMELAGESYWVLGMNDRAAGLPLTMWPVRPDKMTPVTHPTKFIAGYVYQAPDGTRVPFPPEQVIHMVAPDPMDMYHGLSPLAALGVDLDGAVAAAKWNRNFFTNSAEPGGVIEVTDHITDDEFDRLNAQWNEQHKGVANSHRVAILSAGMRWVDRAFSMRDMQFTELRKGSSETIMLGYGMSKTLLGQTEGVNRATAEAAEYVFSRWRVEPRLERMKATLNTRLLPMYQNGGLYEFDFESEVTGNVEEEARDRDSKINAAKELIALGFNPEAVLEAFDLPEIVFDERPTPAAPPSPPPLPSGGPPVLEGRHRHPFHSAAERRPRNAGDPPDLDPDDLPDITRLQDKFDEIMAWLLDLWGPIEDAQKADLVAQVLAIAEGGSIADLNDLAVDIEEAADVLADAMVEIADDGADAVVEEAAEQGVKIRPARADRDLIRDVAAVVAGVVGARLVLSAKNTAMRANSTAATPEDVAGAVEAGLAALSTDGPRPQLSGALTGSQNDGRIATLAAGPVGALYANEVNDANTCGPCREVNGRWLGNTDEMDRVLQSYPGGAYGGYIDCEGRERCRGTITGVWRRGRS